MRPDLPKKQPVATCSAALNPSGRLWGKYVREVGRLQRRGNITEADYVLLVNSLEARVQLMEVTEGDDNVLFQGTIPDILEQVKAAARQKESDDLASLRAVLEGREGESEALTRSIEVDKERTRP